LEFSKISKPSQIKENKIMLLYDHKYEKIHMKNIEQQVHKTVIEKALWVVYKHKLTVQGFLAEDVEGKNDLVESAKKLFGSDVLEITD